jgi:hypothetical protein
MEKTGKKSKSKYIAIGAVIAIASLAAYLSLTINAVAGLSLLAISPFLFCLITCGIMGGVIGGAAWFSHFKTKQHDSMGTDKKSKGCC